MTAIRIVDCRQLLMINNMEYLKENEWKVVVVLFDLQLTIFFTPFIFSSCINDFELDENCNSFFRFLYKLNILVYKWSFFLYKQNS